MHVQKHHVSTMKATYYFQTFQDLQVSLSSEMRFFKHFETVQIVLPLIFAELRSHLRISQS